MKGIGRSLRDREITDSDAKLGWLLVVGTIPAGILGISLEHALRKLFASPTSAAIFLTLNGVMLYGAELLRRRAPVTDDEDDTRIAKTVSWGNAALVGAAQALALIPGFSRSGASMGGGLLVGLSHKDAARFAFLLATPIIGAAAPEDPGVAGPAGRRGAGSGARRFALCRRHRVAFVRFLMRFETRTLTPFAIYRLVAGSPARPLRQLAHTQVPGTKSAWHWVANRA